MGFMGLWAVVALVLLTATAFAAPVVSNVSATQRTDGSGLVDIYYDLVYGGGDILEALEAYKVNAALWSKRDDVVRKLVA